MTCTANASFSSQRPMSSTFRPARSKRRGTANTGPIPISSGSQPATAKPRKIPSGRRPRFSASFASITMQAEAPSENWLALPAATRPPGMAGLIFAIASTVVSGRIPSSAERVTSHVERRPESVSATLISDAKGTSPSANFPAGGALGQGAAHDHVLYLGRIDLRTLHGSADDMSAQGRAVGHVEGASPGLCQTGAGGGDDDGVGHGALPDALKDFPSAASFARRAAGADAA